VAAKGGEHQPSFSEQLIAMADLAIVICCYAPAQEVFSRTLGAVRGLAVPAAAEIECVIVDNNNTPSLVSRDYIAEFLAAVPWARAVVEPRQGLTYARLAGVEATSAPVVIFFDDDNEPAKDYLVAASACLQRHPDVYVWGPGKTIAAFDADVPDAFRKEFSCLFQEREFACVQYGCVPARWESYYPFGTGMIVRREVLAQYRRRLLNGELGCSDRSGQKLSSGGDTQIVWEAVRMGRAAGVSPELVMTHVVPRERATLRYIARLLYGTGSSYLPALIESFPEEKLQLVKTKLSDFQIIRSLLRIVLKQIIRGRKDGLRIQLARYLGPTMGWINAALGQGRKKWVRTLAARLNLE
jgi:hypothetical protein